MESGKGPFREGREHEVVGGRAAALSHPPHHAPAGPDAGRRQHEPETLAGRGEVVLGDPDRQVEERGLDEGDLVDHVEQVFELDVRRKRGRRGAVTTPTARRPETGTTTRAPRSGMGQPSGTR